MKIFYIALTLLATSCSSIALSNTDGSQNQLVDKFGYTCFTQDKVQRDQSIQSVLKFRNSGASSSTMAGMDKAANIGNPDAIMFKCLMGMDKLAPPLIQVNGQAWCFVGAEIIPVFKTGLKAEYLPLISNKEKWSELSGIIEDIKNEMCKVK